MKKTTLSLIALLILSTFLINCGGGSGGSSSPGGEKPGVPEIVQVLPSHYLALTNSAILIRAKILNGNGGPVKDLPVTFTNISPIGVLMNSNDVLLGNQTVVKTDDSGMATIKVKSTTTGFVTVQAEVNKGVGIVRDRKTMYFSSSLSLSPFMYLDVDGDNDGIYDEASDYILFENSTDNQVLIRATVFNKFGQLAFGSVVTFGADWPYKIGSSTACSDGSTSCEVSFPNGNTATTNSSGEAFVLVRVDPITIRNVTAILNITATADNGAANMVTLQLLPVNISTVTVSANPTIVAPDAESDITAAVRLNTGGPAPDGTAVSFTTCDTATCTTTCGSVTPFAQTTDGATTEVTFTAPSTPATCTITASVGGVSDTVDVLVTGALNVLPATQTLTNPVATDTALYTISGGSAPYSAFSSHPSLVSVVVAGTTLTATVVVPPVTDTTVTITVSDNAGATKTVTLILDVPAVVPLTVTPSTQTVSCSIVAGLDFLVSGGTSPYTITSLNPNVTITPNATGFNAAPTACAAFPAASTDVTIAVQDSATPPATVTATLTVTNP